MWGILHRVFIGEEIKDKIKTGIWNSALNSIMKYSTNAINRSKLPDGGVRKFASKCIRGIIIGNMIMKMKEIM